MSMKEKEQVKVFEQLMRREITQKAGSELLGLSERQVRNKLAAYRAEGAASLVHKNRGKPSKRRWKEEEREKAKALLLSDSWKGFGPTFAAEKLAELHSIKISSETLRTYMIGWGMLAAPRKKVKRRMMRERKRMFGVMVQLDGSLHKWFEDNRYYTLLVFIDDATSKILHLEFVQRESVKEVMLATRRYIEQFGRPGSFYVDKAGVFRVNTCNPDHDKLTQWERAMSELKIKVIHAHSPEGKGRVERSNRTHQDRLIKELRLQGIKTVEEANAYLPSYIAKHNSMFSYEATEKGDAHRPLESNNLDGIFCIQEHRSIQNDYTISYKKRILQLTDKRNIVFKPRDSVLVQESFDASLTISIRNNKLEYKEVSQRPKKPVKEKIYNNETPKRVPKEKRWTNNNLYQKKLYIHQPRIY